MEPPYTLVWCEKGYDGEQYLLQSTFSNLADAIKHAFDNVGDRSLFSLFLGAAMHEEAWIAQWKALEDERNGKWEAQREASDRILYERLKAKFEPTAEAALQPSAEGEGEIHLSPPTWTETMRAQGKDEMMRPLQPTAAPEGEEQ